MITGGKIARFASRWHASRRFLRQFGPLSGFAEGRAGPDAIRIALSAKAFHVAESQFDEPMPGYLVLLRTRMHSGWSR